MTASLAAPTLRLSDDLRLGRREPNMMIIGVDYHPSFQQIVFLSEETGECGDRPLNHDRGGPMSGAGNSQNFEDFLLAKLA